MCKNLSQTSAENIIKALDYAFNFLKVPKYLWSDNGKEFTNKLVQSFLKKNIKFIGIVLIVN